jgi:hypothetical protein
VVTVKMTIFWDCGNMLSAKNLPVIKKPDTWICRGRRMKIEIKNSSTNIVRLLPDYMVLCPRRCYCLYIIWHILLNSVCFSSRIFSPANKLNTFFIQSFSFMQTQTSPFWMHIKFH